jgi:hypothetical protein
LLGPVLTAACTFSATTITSVVLSGRILARLATPLLSAPRGLP